MVYDPCFSRCANAQAVRINHFDIPGPLKQLVSCILGHRKSAKIAILTQSHMSRRGRYPLVSVCPCLQCRFELVKPTQAMGTYYFHHNKPRKTLKIGKNPMKKPGKTNFLIFGPIDVDGPGPYLGFLYSYIRSTFGISFNPQLPSMCFIEKNNFFFPLGRKKLSEKPKSHFLHH